MALHPEIPEGINVSKTHPLAEFAYLLVGVALIIFVFVLMAHMLASVMVRYVSFEDERDLFQQFVPDQFYEDERYLEQTAYLQGLAEKLAKHMDLPEGMQVFVHYSPEPIPNAYATLGGNIMIYQGMIDEVSSENGLAMVLAHEMAHIKNRDPVMAMGRATVSLLGLAILSGMGDSSALGGIFNLSGGGLLLKFSRDQEAMADEEAVKAILGLYGTLDGADEFFVSMSEHDTSLHPAFFSTHPATEKRIKRISNAGQSIMPVYSSGLALLPEIFAAKISNQSASDEKTSGENDTSELKN